MWKKHDGSGKCPVDPECLVEIETYTPATKRVFIAGTIDWKCVKIYRIKE